MIARSILPRLAAATALLGLSAGSAAAQGQGYGVGEWNLVTQGGASVCHVVLTNRYIPQQANYRAFVQGGPRCTDWRARNVAMWVVRGNTLKLADGYGREIAGLAEQNPNLYAAGEWALQRVGTGYHPAPGPDYTPPAERPGQGYARGEWNLIHHASGSVCHVRLTGRLIAEQSNYRAIALGGPRCTDWVGQSVFMWVVRGNTLKLADASGRELAALGEYGPNAYQRSGYLLRRRAPAY